MIISEEEKKLLAEKDKKYVWHPFTQMQEWQDEDILIIESGDECYVKDIKGNLYIDGVASLWTNVHGHRNKYIDAAIRNQLDCISHSTFLGQSNVPAILLAEKLVKITPEGLNKVFYSDSGSEATEIAFKVAYQYWCQKANPEPERTKFIHLTDSYHGDTIGAVSVGGVDLFHKIYHPLLFETIPAPAPYGYRCPFETDDKESCARKCIEEMERLVKEHAHETAAVVIEPLMQGAAGMIDQPAWFLKELRRITKENNVLLIFDEVATGFGRTGKMFAAEWAGVSPDIMCVAKGITGGYLPLAATLFTDEIYKAFLGKYEDFKAFFHGHTYTGNQLAARAAIASLELFEKNSIIEKMQPKIELLTQKLEVICGLEHVGDIRQHGFMVGIEIVEDRHTKKPFDAGLKIPHKIVLAARENGVIIRPLGNVMILMPPLTIPKETLIELLDVVYDAIQLVTEQ